MNAYVALHGLFVGITVSYMEQGDSLSYLSLQSAACDPDHQSNIEGTDHVYLVGSPKATGTYNTWLYYQPNTYVSDMSFDDIL